MKARFQKVKEKMWVSIFSLFSVYSLNAQTADQHEWRTLQNQGENFRTIQQLMETKYAGKSTNKKSLDYSRPYKQFKRWEHYWKSRSNEKGAFVSAQQTLDEAIALQQRSSIRGPLTSNWTVIGPTTIPTSTLATYGGMGRINSVAWESGNTQHLFVGSPSGGLWESTNGGTSWSPLTDNLITMGVSDVVVSHGNANHLYLATGDADGQQNSSVGVLKSVDGGANWSQTGLTFAKSTTMQTARIVQHPTTANTLLVTATNGIHKTTDGGNTWTAVYTAAGMHDLEYDPNNPMIMYAAGMGAILKSTDGGSTWNSITPTGLNGRVELGLTAANSSLVLAVDAAGVAMKSTNAGGTWSVLGGFPSNFKAQSGYNLAVAISPIDQNLMLIGGINGWRSTNGGVSWENYLSGYWQSGDPYFYVHSDHHMFKFMPNSNIMFTGNDGGLHRGDASISTPWTDLSSGLVITQFYGLAVAANNAGTIIAGAQDNDASQLNGTTWYNRVGPADGIEGLIDPSNPTMVQYASTQEGGLVRTDNGWTSEIDISPPANSCGFVWPMNLDPTNSNTVYAGCDEIYKSTNKGGAWAPITSGQTGGSVFTKIAIAPSNSNTIYAAYDYNSIIMTTNGGTAWNTLTSPNLNDDLTGIAVDPTNPQKVYITFGGYTGGDKAYVSTNGGTSWTNISGTLPNIPVKCIIAQTGAVNSDVYIGTDLGVFHINSTLSDWQSYNIGLPNVIVNDLEITYSSDKLRAATFGRGVWESDLNSVASAVSNVETETFSMEVFPNPSEGALNIRISNKEMVDTYSLTIYNLIGGVVYHQENVSVGLHTLDLSAVSNGLYLVSIASKTAVQTLKVELTK